MITQTVREAIIHEGSVSPGYVYVIRDGDIVFYVGLSGNPCLRLRQHLGIVSTHSYIYQPKDFVNDMERKNPALNSFHGSQVGNCIRENAPESLEWEFDIYEKQDAIDVVIRTGLAQAFPLVVEAMKRNWYEQRSIVENALIDQLKPFLNSSENSHARNIPPKYRRTPNDSSSLHLEL